MTDRIDFPETAVSIIQSHMKAHAPEINLIISDKHDYDNVIRSSFKVCEVSDATKSQEIQLYKLFRNFGVYEENVTDHIETCVRQIRVFMAKNPQLRHDFS